MATLTSTGIGSGLDVNSIVTQLIALERRPIDQLRSEASRLDARLSSFGRIQSNLDTLRSAARTLTESSTWKAASATSSDSTAVNATVASGSTPGSYTVNVTDLAAAQMNASSAGALGEGTLTIDIGSWAADLSTFTPKAGNTPVVVTIGAGEDTLEKVRDKINSTANLGVRATIVSDSNGARLVLQSRSSGVENGFRVQVADADTVNNDNSGLSRLAYDPENGISVSQRSQPAVNAKATINGLLVESATNTLSNVIDGVSLTLGKKNTGPVDVTVSHDTAAMRKSIDGYVTAYNELVKLLREQTKFDETSKTAGILQGDRTAIAILGQLRSAMSGSSTASTAFARASDIGLSIQTDGSLKLTGSKLDTAFVQLEELQKFFATVGTSSADNGLAERLRQLSDGLIGAEGALPSRQDGLRKLKTSNSDRQQALESRVAATEKRLRAQYQTLDANMARLSSLQNYVGQQINTWNRT